MEAEIQIPCFSILKVGLNFSEFPLNFRCGVNLDGSQDTQTGCKMSLLVTFTGLFPAGTISKPGKWGRKILFNPDRAKGRRKTQLVRPCEHHLLPLGSRPWKPHQQFLWIQGTLIFVSELKISYSTSFRGIQAFRLELTHVVSFLGWQPFRHHTMGLLYLHSVWASNKPLLVYCGCIYICLLISSSTHLYSWFYFSGVTLI